MKYSYLETRSHRVNMSFKIKYQKQYLLFYETSYPNEEANCKNS